MRNIRDNSYVHDGGVRLRYTDSSPEYVLLNVYSRRALSTACSHSGPWISMHRFLTKGSHSAQEGENSSFSEPSISTFKTSIRLASKRVSSSGIVTATTPDSVELGVVLTAHSPSGSAR